MRPVADVLELRRRRRCFAERILLIRVEDHDRARRRRIRKWPQQHRIDDAEDRGRGADADGERDERGGGEQRRASQHAHGIASVLIERGPPGCAFHWGSLHVFGDSAALLPHAVGGADTRRGPRARVGLAQSLRHEAADEHLRMKLQLARDLIGRRGRALRGVAHQRAFMTLVMAPVSAVQSATRLLSSARPSAVSS